MINNLISRRRDSSKIQSFSCDDCGSTYPTGAELANHCHREHKFAPTKKFHCPGCHLTDGRQQQEGAVS